MRSFLVPLAFALLPLNAMAESGLSPWRFGMTPTEVTSFSKQGPYRSFSNGDLEAFNYPLNGQALNVQFFFEPQDKGAPRLSRIAIAFYEGNDLEKAKEGWRRAYAYLQESFGPVELPDIKVTVAGSANVSAQQALAPPVLAHAVAANAVVTGKTQMAPKTQPADKHVFSSFLAKEFGGENLYIVFVYHSKP